MEALIQELPKFRLKAVPTDCSECPICLEEFHVGNEVILCSCLLFIHPFKQISCTTVFVVVRQNSLSVFSRFIAQSIHDVSWTPFLSQLSKLYVIFKLNGGDDKL